MGRKSQKEGKEYDPVKTHQPCRQIQETNERAENTREKICSKPHCGNGRKHDCHGSDQGGKDLLPKGAKERFVDYGTAQGRQL